MADNGPNRSTSPEALLERAQAAGKVVSRFMRGDQEKFAEAARRLPADHPHKPALVQHNPLIMRGRERFPYLHSSGDARLILRYPDGVNVFSRHVVTDDEEPFNDTLIDETQRTTDYFLNYQSGEINISTQIVDFVGTLYFNGIEVPDVLLTEEIVQAYEDLAERVQPLVDAALVG